MNPIVGSHTSNQDKNVRSISPTTTNNITDATYEPGNTGSSINDNLSYIETTDVDGNSKLIFYTKFAINGNFMYVFPYSNDPISGGEMPHPIYKIDLTNKTRSIYTNTTIPGELGNIVIYNNYMYIVYYLPDSNLFRIAQISLVPSGTPTVDLNWYEINTLSIHVYLNVYNTFLYISGMDTPPQTGTKVIKINLTDVESPSYTKNEITVVTTDDAYHLGSQLLGTHIYNDDLYLAYMGKYISKVNLSDTSLGITIQFYFGIDSDYEINTFFIYNDCIYMFILDPYYIYHKILKLNMTNQNLTIWRDCPILKCIKIDGNYIYATTSTQTVNKVMRFDVSSLPDGGGDPGGGAPGGGIGGGGSTDHFFINDPFTISQTANIYSNNLPYVTLSTYDYILDIDINSVWDSMNDLFEDRRFMTEFNDVEGASADILSNLVLLNVNRTKLSALLEHNNTVTITSNMQNVYSTYINVFNTIDTSKQLTGFRFLEIVATKVFGHAKTKIAIENSEEYYMNDYVDADTAVNSLIGQITKGLYNSVITMKNEIMNEYIQTDRIEDNANDAPISNIEIDGSLRRFMEYNFNDTVWEFPIYFQTTLATTGDDSISELNNGPIVGGVQLINGSVNVPILLRFYKG